MLRAVEGDGAGSGVECVPHGNLVADDEHRGLGALEQALERLCISERRIVQALAAWKGIVSRVRALPGAVLVERRPFEVADVDVVEEGLFDAWDAPSAQRFVSSLPRPP